MTKGPAGRSYKGDDLRAEYNRSKPQWRLKAARKKEEEKWLEAKWKWLRKRLYLYCFFHAGHGLKQPFLESSQMGS